MNKLKILIAEHKGLGATYRVVGRQRDDEEIADISLERKSVDSNGTEYWSVVDRYAVWSFKNRENFNRRHGDFGVKAQMFMDQFLFDMCGVAKND